MEETSTGSSLDVALKYMEIFYSGKNLEQLFDILAKNLKFEGPFHQFESAQEYVEALVANPPEHCTYHLERVFEDEEWVNLLYTFSKPGISTPMSQLFHIQAGRIVRIVLIFDTAQFL
ncbi:nuclear transport factor 2 family protein [Magnetococcales bacterium HHB-1]